MANVTLNLPNLIQGVSQQAVQQRRVSQCEREINCFNSPVDGCGARPSFEWLGKLTETGGGGPLQEGNLRDAFYYEIERENERYLVVIAQPTGTPLATPLRIWNITGAPVLCSVTMLGASASYLALTGNTRAGEAFAVAPVDDYLFIANKQKVPAMSGTGFSGVRPKEAIMHFKAGNYLVSYRVTITHASFVYTYTYTTPDNSTAGNARYIHTNHLAATFFRAMAGGATGALAGTQITYLEAAGAVGQQHAGAGGTMVGATNLTTLGFNLSINGNAIHIWHETDNFTIDVDDGLNNANLIAFQQEVQSFSKLPNTGFAGYVVKVQGESKAEADDYYVKYSNTTSAVGRWQESIAPGIPRQLDAATMPHQLINTALNTFTFGPAPWASRVVGDEESDPDPSFVGQPIADMFRNNTRLGIMTGGSVTWSAVKNVYVFFRKTVQTAVEDDPIDLEVSGPKPAQLRKGVIANELISLWASRLQFGVRKSDNAFAAKNLEIKPSTAYDFAVNVSPFSVGSSLYFVTEDESGLGGGYERFAAVRDLLIQDGRPAGDTDVTDHVPRLIPAGVDRLSASDTVRCLGVTTRGRRSSLYFYNYFTNNGERIQSAWNEWPVPLLGHITWFSFANAVLRMVVQLPGNQGAALVYMVLARSYRDPGGDYHTRLDARITDAQLTAATTYDVNTDESTLTMPYEPSLGLQVVCRQSVVNGFNRGRLFEVLSVSGSTLKVRGDVRTTPLYLGWRISSEQELSRPYQRDEDGAVPIERVQMRSIEITHDRTGYYRVMSIYEDDPHNTAEVEFEGRVLGAFNNQLDQVMLSSGTHKVPVKKENTRCRVSLINDSFLPSYWQSAQWTYQPTERASRG